MREELSHLVGVESFVAEKRAASDAVHELVDEIDVVTLGLSMGGYIAFEVMRQAPDRVERLALLDTSALPDTPEQSERRLTLTALAASRAGSISAQQAR
jgi:pimeloyl-ACP methyl ester carboxylesterase